MNYLARCYCHLYHTSVNRELSTLYTQPLRHVVGFDNEGLTRTNQCTVYLHLSGQIKCVIYNCIL